MPLDCPMREAAEAAAIRAICNHVRRLAIEEVMEAAGTPDAEIRVGVVWSRSPEPQGSPRVVLWWLDQSGMTAQRRLDLSSLTVPAVIAGAHMDQRPAIRRWAQAVVREAKAIAS